jgi:hypothetical protein
VRFWKLQGMTAAEMMPFLENVDVIIFGSTYCDGFTVHGDYSATVTGAECEAGWKKVLEEVLEAPAPLADCKVSSPPGCIRHSRLPKRVDGPHSAAHVHHAPAPPSRKRVAT